MKKAILAFGLAFFAFTGVYAQVETGTQPQEETQQEETQMEEPQNPEDVMAQPAEDAQSGKVEVTYDELPEAVKSQYQEAEITEAYKVAADPATGSTETTFEVHTQDAATAESKVITFDENGEEVNDAGSE